MLTSVFGKNNCGCPGTIQTKYIMLSTSLLLNFTGDFAPIDRNNDSHGYSERAVPTYYITLPHSELSSEDDEYDPFPRTIRWYNDVDDVKLSGWDCCLILLLMMVLLPSLALIAAVKYHISGGNNSFDDDSSDDD